MYYQQNQMGPNGMQANVPYGYQANPQPQTQPENVNYNFLTPKEIEALKKQPQSFQTKLSNDEYLRSKCTHRYATNGQFAIEELNDHPGHCRCAICGAEWDMIDLNTPDEDISSICSNFNDLFQTIKTYYANVPQAMQEIYIISGFISKMPQLWKIAKKVFEKSAGFQNDFQNRDGDQAGFQMLANILGNSGVGMGMGMPGYGYYNPAPMYAPTNPVGYAAPGQPVYNAPYSAPAPNGQPVAPQNNPYVGAPAQPGYGMNTNNFVQQTPAPSSANPIGYVDNQQDFTTNMNNQQTTVQNVAMPGPNVNAGTQSTPAMPEPPKNPNLQSTKANVDKNFVG